MKRDGRNKSLWVNGLHIHENSPVEQEFFDAVIVGAGITGLTLALELQQRGKNCLVLEQNNIGFGTTGGTTAHINNFFDESYDRIISKFGEDRAQTIADNASRVSGIIKNNIDRYGIDCEYEECSFYLFSAEKKQDRQLENIAKAHDALDIPTMEVNTVPFTVPFRKAIKIKGQAQFHPLRYIEGLAKAFQELGGKLLTGYLVTDYSVAEDKLKITTSGGLYFMAEDLIWATHIPPGINRFNALCAPYRSYALAAKLPYEVTEFAQAADLYDPYHYMRYHKIGHESYIIVGGFDHKTGHEEDTEKPMAQLVEYTREHFKVSEISATWSSQFYAPADGLPYIGKMPGDDHVYVATGYNGNGMTWSTLAGTVLADLIEGKDNELADIVSPSRIEIAASAKEFVKENIDAVFHLVKDQFTSDKKAELDGIEKGDGQVIDYNGKKVAAFRDDLGAVKLLDAHCPHMGCVVKFNKTEKSWDCPCHGSRFDTEGAVLTIPAQQGLKQL